MGTKVHRDSYFSGYHHSTIMRDLNEDLGSNWPTRYRDKVVTNGQYYNDFISRTMMDSYPIRGKDALKQRMLEHEAIFKGQLYELHRLYRIQRDMMEEVKKKELNRPHVSMEPPSSSSSSLRGSHLPSRDGFPLFNSGYSRKSASGVEFDNSPLSCTKEYSTRHAQLPFQNGSTSKEYNQALDSRPLKVRKKLFDLQLPPEKNIDTEEETVDLNEPFRVEVETVASCIDHVSTNRYAKEVHLPEKSNTRSVAVNGESVHLRDGFSIKSGVENKVSEGRVPHIYEAGPSKSNLFMQGTKHRDLLYSDQSRVQSNNGHLEHREAFRPSGSCPFATPSCFPNSWAHTVSPHLMSSSSFTQKRATFDSSLNSMATMDRSQMLSAQTQVSLGRNWPVDASSSLNPNLASESTTKNGFYHGSASLTREPQHCSSLSGFSYLNWNRDESSGQKDKIRAIDIDLNEVDVENKPEDNVSELPWLKQKLPHNIDLANSKQAVLAGNNCEIGMKKEIGETNTVKKILGIPIFETKTVMRGTNNEQKKRIFDINLECEPGDNIDAQEHSLDKENQSEFNSKRDLIDLNSCVIDSEDATLPSLQSETASVKRIIEIDLEAPPLEENDDDIIPPFKENIADSSLRSLENKPESIHDKALANAAETILAMSSFCPQEAHVEENSCEASETSLSDSLLWFVDIVSSFANDDDSIEKEILSEEIDEFEAMTLQLQEMNEEAGYVPRPFVPEVQEHEETGTNNSLLTRSRRGHSRRGRQRKDFQRDILPGLATLSRHEVTEDLQTFGGLMRAMGHHWNSGPTRRNGGRNGGPRGRRRVVTETFDHVVQTQVCVPLVQKLGNIETILEDRSLTGWGKTTRRPRRQRCHAGNNNNTPTAVFT